MQKPCVQSSPREMESEKKGEREELLSPEKEISVRYFTVMKRISTVRENNTSVKPTNTCQNSVMQILPE